MITRLSIVFIVLLDLTALVNAGVPVATREAVDLDKRNIIGRDEVYEDVDEWAGGKYKKGADKKYERVGQQECAPHDDKVDLRQSANAVFQWQLHAGRHAGGADQQY
ncbi:hypothetical protein EV424DRAFT_1352168 [Suillus variegatus]|nr:hypothetical protein EV424DRAFT_1352168 [Suillus variegatus]